MHADFVRLRDVAAPDLPDEVLGRVLLVWTAMFGGISYELFGHLHGSSRTTRRSSTTRCAVPAGCWWAPHQTDRAVGLAGRAGRAPPWCPAAEQADRRAQEEPMSEDPTQLVKERVTALLEEHDPKVEDFATFRGHQYDAGLAWVHFPEGWGGLGLAPDHQQDIDAALREAGARSPDAPLFFGLTMAGPTVVTHGDEALRRRLLRPMFTGEDSWCQLFSEPGAGSDLAGLACKAVRDGDEWVITGQKVWNTLAHLANRGMLVARTDPDAPKHKGMTYFALDMHAPGVEVRPLRQITGEAEFNEVYLTEVRVPDSRPHRRRRRGLAGRHDHAVQRAHHHRRRWRRARLVARAPSPRRCASGRTSPTSTRRRGPRPRSCSSGSEAEVLRLTNIRGVAEPQGRQPRPRGLDRQADVRRGQQGHLRALRRPARRRPALVDYDYDRRGSENLGLTGAPGASRKMFLRSRANSIEGGTSEIQRNIIGERVLGLPGEPRTDKDVPWKDVPRS